MAYFRKILCSILFVIFTILLLSACSSTVVNRVDELTLNSWENTFDNGNTVSLSFFEDSAILSVTTDDKNSATIIGLCELSESQFVIHDNSTKQPYCFEYNVQFDKVEVIFNSKSVLLYKK